MQHIGICTGTPTHMQGQGLVGLGQAREIKCRDFHVQLQMKLLCTADLPVETWERFGPFEIEAPLSDMPTILLHSKIDVRGT